MGVGVDERPWSLFGLWARGGAGLPTAGVSFVGGGGVVVTGEEDEDGGSAAVRRLQALTRVL